MHVIRWHIFWIWYLVENDLVYNRDLRMLIYESKQKHRQECGFYATIVRCKNMSGMDSSVKNKHDSLFFTRLFVPQASQSSPYRRIKFEI